MTTALTRSERRDHGFAVLKRFNKYLRAAGLGTWISLSHSAIKGLGVTLRSGTRWRGKVPAVFEEIPVTVFVAYKVKL